jgi:hypothetical protein
MKLPAGFRRLKARELCSVCGHAGWCLTADDGSDRVLCKRVQSSRRWKDAGWLHGAPLHERRLPHVTIEDAPDFEAWARIARDCRTRLLERSDRRWGLAVDLGISVEGMDALEVGLHGRASTWPMRDHHRRVIGIRLRYPNEKRAMRGSRNGLFLPNVPEQELVLVTEGESDLAAALTLGFFGIGRPGCMGGADLIVRWLRARSPRDVVIFADGDEPGILGAVELGRVVQPFARSLRIVVPPPAMKDLRAALRAGAARADVLSWIESAPQIERAMEGRSL